MLLTALTINLASMEIFHEKVIGIASALIFLALPVTSAMASHYAFYLDVSFTFFISLILFAMVKIYKYRSVDSTWWIVLGLSISLSMMERDLAFFLLPCVVAIMLTPAIKSSNWLRRPLRLLLLLIVFTAAYNFFFVYNLASTGHSILNAFILETPVLLSMLLFAGLSRVRLADLKLPGKKTLFLTLSPMVFPFVFILRNILAAGAITSNLPMFNSDWRLALTLMAEAGRASVPVTNLGEIFHWSTLLTSLQEGGVVIIPLLIGIFVVLFYAFKKSGDHDRTSLFIFLSFSLSLILMWSWVFGSSYQGSELRRLYYFAPVIAIFSGAGMVWFAQQLKLGHLRQRVAIFLALVTAYFWFESFGSTWNILKIAYSFDSLGSVTVTLFIVFSAFFILAFYPSSMSILAGDSERIKVALTRFGAAVTILLIVVSCSFVAYNSSMIIANQSRTATLAPTGWENDLSSVITYLNQNYHNNDTIIASYALPISYFTPHPVIDVTMLTGVVDLLHMSGDTGNITNELLSRGIHYLLLPTPQHNYFDYTQNLGENISVLSQQFLESTPNLVLLKDFHSFKLYEIVPTANLSQFYSYLYTNASSWSATDSGSQILGLDSGLSILGGGNDNLTLQSANLATFWTAGGATSSDLISITNDSTVKDASNVSLRIQLDGTGNMEIEHIFNTTQDWSRFAFLSMYFYGENTSKSVTLSFHTNGWQDYFAASFVDNFAGWKRIEIPLDSFTRYGTPTWSKISFMEFLMGGRTTTYWMDDISFQGYRLGVSGSIPAIVASGNTTRVVVSADANSTSYPIYLIMNSTSGIFEQELRSGTSYVTVPSEYVSQSSTVELFTPTLSSNDELTLYYFGVLSS